MRKVLIIILIIFCGLSFAIGGYFYFRNDKNDENGKIEDNSQKTEVTQDGVTMSIDPNRGPVRTEVTVNISGLPYSEELNIKIYFKGKNEIYYDGNSLIQVNPQSLRNNNGVYTYTAKITIPEKMVYHFVPKPIEKKTPLGQGHIGLYYSQSFTTEGKKILIPFTVTEK